MKSNETIHSALKDLSKFLCLKAKTAPKTKGIDNLHLLILNNKQKNKLAHTMRKIGLGHKLPSFIRDSKNIKDAAVVILFGIAANPAGLKYCGCCQKANCDQLTKSKGICAFNAIDLGIALGTAVSLGANFGADNRLMYSAGITALKLGFFEKKIKLIIALPLSGTGKNIFFDRS